MERALAIALPTATVRAIEGLAARAWPARVVEALHGWQLAFTDGLTRRINSAQTLDWSGQVQLERAIEQVEAFYAGRGLPARFRLTPLSRPAGLEDGLKARGYETEAPTDVLVGEAGRIPLPPSGHTVALAATPPADWLALWLADQSEEDAAKRRALLARLPPTTTFALARTGSEPAGLGFAVVEAGWAGLFAMQTAGRFRGQGIGGAILGALIERARAMGARRAYLQVEQDNAAARRLYARAGFTFGYSYHYRTRFADRP